MTRPEPADLTQGSTSRISKNSGNSAKLQSQPMVKRDCSNQVILIQLFSSNNATEKVQLNAYHTQPVWIFSPADIRVPQFTENGTGMSAGIKIQTGCV